MFASNLSKVRCLTRLVLFPNQTIAYSHYVTKHAIARRFFTGIVEQARREPLLDNEPHESGTDRQAELMHKRNARPGRVRVMTTRLVWNGCLCFSSSWLVASLPCSFNRPAGLHRALREDVVQVYDPDRISSDLGCERPHPGAPWSKPPSSARPGKLTASATRPPAILPRGACGPKTRSRRR